MNFRTIIEPFKIKSVEPISVTTEDQRTHFLGEAFYNPFKLKSEHVIVQDEVKGYDKPKPAANVANTEDKLAKLAADREARRLARQAQLNNGSGSNSNPTEEQINDNPTPTEEQINDAYNKLQAFVKAKTDLDADPTKADSKKTYNKALAALKATDQGLYANLSEEDKTAYQAALTATNA